MSLNEANRADLVQLYWNKSEKTYDELLGAIELKKWSMAANRLYYSLFHAMSALLIKDEHPVNSHRGVKHAIGQYYVLTGKLSSDEGRFYAQMVSLREKADYDIVFQATEVDIQEYLPLTTSLLAKIKELIESK